MTTTMTTMSDDAADDGDDDAHECDGDAGVMAILSACALANLPLS